MEKNYISNDKCANDTVIDCHTDFLETKQIPDDISKNKEHIAAELKNPSEIPFLDESTVITDKVHNQALDQVIFKALQKVKEYFINSKMNEQKLAEFMYRMLSLNENDDTSKDIKFLNSDTLEDFVNEMLKNEEFNNEIDDFNNVIDKLMGEDIAKTICDKLTTEKVDEIVENLLGKETKKLLCEKLDSDNLDDLLNKLVDEKINLDNDPEAKHPIFDEFIEKILGKDVEEFIRKKLELFTAPAAFDVDEECKILEVDEVE